MRFLACCGIGQLAIQRRHSLSFDKKLYDNIRISVIVPVYNVAAYLDQCIKSVLSQSYRDLELILVDDGSTDGSGHKCDCWANKDTRVQVLHKANKGLSSARNAGFLKAQGQYIVFIDSDDYWGQDSFLQQAVDALSDAPVDIVAFGHRKVTDRGDIISTYIPAPTDSLTEAIKQGAIGICAWNLIVRRSLLQDHAIIFREGVIDEDLEWVARLYAAADTAKVLDISPYCYRQRSGSITKTVAQSTIDDVKSNYQHCLALQQHMTGEKLEAFLYYLARAMSMFVIALSSLDEGRWNQYYDFIKTESGILSYTTRRREKLIAMSLKLLGVKNTLRLLRQANRRVNKSKG